MSQTKTRKRTRQIRVGDVAVGGDAPVSVQTMTKTDTRDVDTTIRQILELEKIGCDIIRIAVVDNDAAAALGKIKKRVNIPVVADIHFDHKLALSAIDAGVDGLRINPGNIGDTKKVEEIARAARGRELPIRVGVNSGSLEKDIEEKFGGRTPEALVESAMRHVKILEDLGHEWIKISVKASDVRKNIAAYRLLSERTDHPIHLGVTEAGTFLAGTVRSCVAMSTLLQEGIGDTLRVSLSDQPANEIRVGLELLRSLGLREPGANVIACPTCGRIQVDVISLAGEIEKKLEAYYAENPEHNRPLVAVMGCMVNGPGEAKDADIAIAGGDGKFALYLKGVLVKTVAENAALDAVMEQVSAWKGK